MLRMAHDQNFCGNRLRLSTFLRVVKENTLRPPSRFQRHAQYVAQIHAGEDQISSGSCDLGRYIVPSTGAPVEASCKHANLEGASPRRPPSDCNCSELLQPASGCASPGSSGDTWVAQISKLTSSQVDLVLHIDDKNRKDFRHEFASHQQVQTSERSGNDIVYKVKPRGVDIPAHNSPSTRRRRLPVNELALKRTTTVDGLPDRTEEHVIQRSLITETDPIEDSQLNPPAQVPVLNSQLRFIQAPPSQNTLRPAWATKSPWKSKPGVKSRVYAGRNPQRLKRSDMHSTSDGFVGTELCIPQRLNQRLHKPQKQKSQTMLRRNCGLALAAGELPAPFDYTALHPASDSQPSPPSTQEDGISAGPVFRGNIPPYVLGPDSGSTDHEQGVLTQRMAPSYSPTELDREIFYQLTSVTAPSRNNTESDPDSDSGNSCESSYGDDDDEMGIHDSMSGSELLSSEVLDGNSQETVPHPTLPISSRDCSGNGTHHLGRTFNANGFRVHYNVLD